MSPVDTVVSVFRPRERIDRISVLDIELYLVNSFRKRESETQRERKRKKQESATLREHFVAQIKIGDAPTRILISRDTKILFGEKNRAKFLGEMKTPALRESSGWGKINGKKMKYFSLSPPRRSAARFMNETHARARGFTHSCARSHARAFRGGIKRERNEEKGGRTAGGSRVSKGRSSVYARASASLARAVKVRRPFNFGFPRAENIRARHFPSRGIAERLTGIPATACRCRLPNYSCT